MEKVIKEEAVGFGTGDKLKKFLDIVHYSMKMKEESIKNGLKTEVDIHENDCIKFVIYKDSIIFPGKVLMFDFIVPSTHITDMEQLHNIFMSKMNEFIIHVVDIENPTPVNGKRLQ